MSRSGWLKNNDITCHTRGEGRNDWEDKDRIIVCKNQDFIEYQKKKEMKKKSKA